MRLDLGGALFGALLCVTLAGCAAHQGGAATPSAADDFEGRLASSCNGDDAYLTCRAFRDEMFSRSVSCDQVWGQRDCVAVPSVLQRATARLADLKSALMEGIVAQNHDEIEALRGKINQGLAENERERAQRDRINEWSLSIIMRCSLESSTRVCKEAPEGTPSDMMDRCVPECRRVAEGSVRREFEEALQSCLGRYAAANGHGVPKCDVSLPETADLAGDALRSRTEKCSKQCGDEGPAALADARARARADRDAAQLVLSYKRCMVVTDATPLARKYQEYDTELYRNLLEKANTTCRSASRCDWVERNSTNVCGYTPYDDMSSLTTTTSVPRRKYPRNCVDTNEQVPLYL